MQAAGKRRHRVTIERHNGKRDACEPTYARDEDWEPLCQDVPASYQDVSGGETIRGRQMEARTVGLVTLLQTPRTRQVGPKCRLRLGDRVLYVVNRLDLDGLGQEFAIQVAETVE